VTTPATADDAVEGSESSMVVRVRPDVAAIDREFDYLVPEAMHDRVQVGTMVRIALGPRRVGGWVVATDVTPPEGVKLQPIAKVRGHGPGADIIELAEWASHRWAGPIAKFLTTASAARAIVTLPPVPSQPEVSAPSIATPSTPTPTPPSASGEASMDSLSQIFAVARTHLVRLAPGADRWPLIRTAVEHGTVLHGNVLVLAPDHRTAQALAQRLRSSGVVTASMPDQWGRAAAGATVVGARAAAWAPVVDLTSIVVLDEHDEGYQEESAPTWNSRDVAIERARRAGVPCVLVSPTPSLEALAAIAPATPLAPERSAEAAGWPQVTIVDQREQDTVRYGRYSVPMLRAINGEGSGDNAATTRPVTLCVLNRKGRARLLVCTDCDGVLTCETCGGGVQTVEADKASATALGCARCETRRPTICNHCGRTRIKQLRVGVSKIAEELETLLREQVVEVTGDSSGQSLAGARIYVGTEAVLHQVPRADLVVFLDIDQELLAPRYRAAEQALALVARAARLVGGRSRATRGRPGRIVFQTRLPDHEVLQAALRGAPELVSEAEAVRRQMLQFPPATALAAISGAVASQFVGAMPKPLPDGIEVLGPNEGMWLVRAPDHAALSSVLHATPRPSGRLRVAVDPLRI